MSDEFKLCLIGLQLICLCVQIILCSRMSKEIKIIEGLIGK